jgi:hypothetical protein
MWRDGTPWQGNGTRRGGVLASWGLSGQAVEYFVTFGKFGRGLTTYAAN